ASGKKLSEVLILHEEKSFRKVELELPLNEEDHALKIRGYAVALKTGTQVPVALSASYIRDENGIATGVVIVLQDISDQKLAEEEIRQARDRAELIYRVTPSAIFTIDRQCNITTWNDRAYEITGYSPDESIGKKCWFFEKDECAQQCIFFPEGRSTMPMTGVEGTIVTKTGTKRVVSRNLDYLRNSLGEIIGGIESFEDITERRVTEQELRESEMKFRSVIQTAGDAIILADSGGRVISWNRGAEIIFGYS
ncbi:MAG: PAS domain S-box protein, partial [Desulfobacterales bacterium]|nr:PAS domain S-box protein [Desulfobacterales bacterium]